MDDHENIDINDNSSDANTANYNQDKNENTSEVNDYSKEDIEGDENLKSSKGKQENNTKSSSDKDENTIDYGNHDFPCNPAPPVPIKLFIGRVPKNIEEDQLRPIFEEYGIVNEVVIIRDKITNVHKSSAFVKNGFYFRS